MRPRLLGLGVVLLASAAGCTAAPTAPESPSLATVSATAQAADPIETGIRESPEGASDAASAAKDPGTPAASAPATTSGELSPRELPAPEEVGAGWEYRVEGLDTEEGPGNGSPYQEREPSEVVSTAVPLGCEQRSDLPSAENVLQATYESADGAFAVALRLRFDSSAHARRFLAQRAEDLRACLNQPDDPYTGAAAPVLSVDSSARTTLARYEYPGEDQPWTSMMVRSGADVLSVDANPARQGLVDWSTLEQWLG